MKIDAPEKHAPAAETPPPVSTRGKPALPETIDADPEPPIRRLHKKTPPFATPPGCVRLRLPCVGWLDVDDDTRQRVDHLFHVPMLILSLLVLPVLGLEYLQWKANESQTSFWGQQYLTEDWLTVAVGAAMVVIWLAFMVEFTVKIAIAPNRLRYAARNWLDIVIIALPMLRPFRGMRALRAARIANVSRVFTLRGVVVKFARTAGAFVLGLEGVRRLRARFIPPADNPQAPPDYHYWTKSALIEEIERLKRENILLKKEKPNHRASKK
jgi:hypothetical protein